MAAKSKKKRKQAIKTDQIKRARRQELKLTFQRHCSFTRTTNKIVKVILRIQFCPEAKKKESL